MEEKRTIFQRKNPSLRRCFRVPLKRTKIRCVYCNQTGPLSLNPIPRLYLGRIKRIWYLSPVQAAKVQASLRFRAVSPEPPLLAHTSSESRGTFRQKARSLVPMNGWACAVINCHDGMLEDTNSLDMPHFVTFSKQMFTKQSKTWRTDVNNSKGTKFADSMPNLAFFLHYGYKIYAGEVKMCNRVESKNNKTPIYLPIFPGMLQ